VLLREDNNIQPEPGKLSKWWQKVLLALDIFSFIPVPQTRPVSTKRSKIGSILLILIFLVYIIYDFVWLLINNPPKVNTY